MDAKAKELFIGLGEIIAAHQILRYAKDGNEEERMRLVTGAGMGALGYIYGPKLHERIREQDQPLSERMSESLTYAIGGAVAGAIIGHYSGPKLFSGDISVPREVADAFRSSGEAGLTKRPTTLVVGISAAYLAYALFREDKEAEQYRKNAWMLGAASLGYAFGPEIMRKTKDIVLPQRAAEDALERYSRAGAAIGLVGGAVLGYYKGEAFTDWARGRLLG